MSLHRILATGTRRPLFLSAATRAIEQQAQATLPAHTLMQRAGLAAARLALAVAPHARRIWVAAGPGNNGGDGLEAAHHLQRAGRAVTVSLLGDAARLPADAAASLRAAQAAGVSIIEGLTPAADADLALDAVLGLGQRRAPQGVLAAAVARLNTGTAPVLALDLPTGLAADTGACWAPAVRARHTLSLLTLKPGLFTAHGRDLAGDLWFDDLGIDAPPAPDAWLGPQRRAPGARRHAEHKGSYGDVVAIGGAEGMAGALALAARAALMAGAGRVYVDPLAPEPPLLAPELMLRRGLGADVQASQRATVVAGCGGGDAVAAALPAVLAHAARLVLDADALNAVATSAALQQALRDRAQRSLPTLLTPHPLEAARLLGSTTAEVQADRLQAARELSRRCAATVVLKGSGSVIADASGNTPVLNPSGNALLATAGTGDVLAGWLAGAWSAAAAQATPLQELAAAVVWRHGHAADTAALAGRDCPLNASALIDAMAALPHPD